MMFIIMHQTHELWFKAILHEIDSIADVFALAKVMSTNQLAVLVQQMGRIVRIMKILVQQFDVLETMNAIQFHKFSEQRFIHTFTCALMKYYSNNTTAGDFISPASGFQSKQFRMIENSLGMREESRIQHSGCPYIDHLRLEDREDVEERYSKTILEYVENWLENVIIDTKFDFVDFMRKEIELAAEREIQAQKLIYGVDVCVMEITRKMNTRLTLFSLETHQKMLVSGQRHISFMATMGAVMIHTLHTDMPLEYSVLMKLSDIDDIFQQWRQRHSQIVLRMLGSKNGTGGSSGHPYLLQTLNRSRIFMDLSQCVHYIIPELNINALRERTALAVEDERLQN
jgi:tryptophan 2,3-dioxygenase